MPSKILKELKDALGRVDRPGTFCVSGQVPALLPGLEVKGLGPIGLPLVAGQAKELIKHCKQAPYGQGEKTLVDTKVRRVWKIDPAEFSLTNPLWDRTLESIVAKVQVDLGLEKQELEGHLHDLLVYEPGSFFLPHRDGEKLGRMVATLVVVLPSRYEGGELLVRHDGQERSIDFRGEGDGSFHIHYAAFYADCEHEVRPIREGYRLCLVYNLTMAKATKAIQAPRVSDHVDQVGHLIRAWAEKESEGKLVITLDHQYTKDGLTSDALKGVDRVKAQVLLEAAGRAGCRAYLALLTYWESGSAEYSERRPSRSRRRWSYRDESDDGDASDYDMGEIFDSSLIAGHLSDRDGRGLPIGELSVDEAELLDPDALKKIDPEVEFEGYTGNAGMTLDHWYHHAAVLLWPESQHFTILCDRDSRAIGPVLVKMVTDWASSKDQGLKDRCLRFATAILSGWSDNPHAWGLGEKDDDDDLLKALAALGDLDLIRLFLGDVMLRDFAVEPGPSVATILQKLGWETFRPELLAVMKGTTNNNLGRNVRVLERICSARPRKKQGWIELSGDLSGELVSRLESIDRDTSVPDWQAERVDRAGILAGLVRSLGDAGQLSLLGKLIEHALALPKRYPLLTTHYPAVEALRPWLKKDFNRPCPPMANWVAWVRGQLEVLTSQAPREPADFRRPSETTCKCPDCAELKRFLDDPAESVHRFGRRQDLRSHLEHRIRDGKFDLDCSTEKLRSPHSLVCRKNQASYLRNLETYRENLERLATIRSIEAGLPGL